MTATTGTVAAVVSVIVCALILVGLRAHTAESVRGKAVSSALQVAYEADRELVRGRLNAPKDVRLQLVNDAGQVVAGTEGALAGPPMANFQPPATSIYATRERCPPAGLKGCQRVIALRVYNETGDRFVYAATPIVPWYVSPGHLMLLVCAALLVTMIACLRAWGTTDQVLARVDAIRAELAEITASKSGRRVTVPPYQDEIRWLAQAANETLDRLDSALERQRSFTSDASHDLRSPITGARAQLEEALLFPDEVDWPQTARNVLHSLDRLQAIVTDLLQLARLDAGDAWQRPETIDLGAVVTIEVARAERTKAIHTHLQEGVTVRGDRLRLVRLLTNLLDNAERHAESRVDITVRDEDGYGVLEVQDDGAGVAEEDREVVFQRFARLEAGKARDAAGTGLGLPIAREIARLHGGTLTIEDSDRGARFVLRIPRSPGSADRRATGNGS
ncbi:HAMP domain-containing sensor histidine kinase [Actinomadura sp. 7K534]|uniref:sensor histidine kinase n=1 Tax=Actinomadura sp. 7K534 TaxID=2530366 RepID=UPI00104F7B20|nr:HAMP domain-containing sensor histidine kinase [Actinomadura sp. 7K534]TDB92493.1 HAMP domain-containing histidine kinase [Actinomadura sp. 7K534]